MKKLLIAAALVLAALVSVAPASAATANQNADIRSCVNDVFGNKANDVGGVSMTEKSARHLSADFKVTIPGVSAPVGLDRHMGPWTACEENLDAYLGRPTVASLTAQNAALLKMLKKAFANRDYWHNQYVAKKTALDNANTALASSQKDAKHAHSDASFYFSGIILLTVLIFALIGLILFIVFRKKNGEQADAQQTAQPAAVHHFDAAHRGPHAARE